MASGKYPCIWILGPLGARTWDPTEDLEDGSSASCAFMTTADYLIFVMWP